MASASAGDVRELAVLKDELGMLASELEGMKSKKDQAKARKDYDLLDELETRGNELR